MQLVPFAIALALSSFSTAAVAQDALTFPGPLRIAAVGQTRVVMVQGGLADPFVWEWTFLDEDADGDGETFDTMAMSVMYDCASRSRRPLVLEAYRDGSFVFQTPIYEEPSPVSPGTLADGALDVVCEPEANSDGAVFTNMVSARVAMDGRAGPTIPPFAAQ